MGPGPFWTDVENLIPTGIRNVASRYTDWANCRFMCILLHGIIKAKNIFRSSFFSIVHSSMTLKLTRCKHWPRIIIGRTSLHRQILQPRYCGMTSYLEVNMYQSTRLHVPEDVNLPQQHSNTLKTDTLCAFTFSWLFINPKYRSHCI